MILSEQHGQQCTAKVIVSLWESFQFLVAVNWLRGHVVIVMVFHVANLLKCLVVVVNMNTFSLL